MAGETVITIVGNLTGDPELRFTASGVAVAGFSVASTPRVWSREQSTWVDGQPLFMRVQCWREMAEHVADSLRKGMRVVVTGRLEQRRFTDRQGVERTVIEMVADEVAASLRFAVAEIQRGGRVQAGGYTQASRGYVNPAAAQAVQDSAHAVPQAGQQAQQAPAQQVQGDGVQGGWGSPAEAGSGAAGGDGGGFDDMPPW